MRKIQLKRKLATFATLLCLMSMMPLTALAEVINTVTSSETITKTSTVYVGEVVVDGVTQIKYLYSGDISIYSYVIQNILDGMNGMADGDYAALLEEHEFDYGSQTTGFAICSNPDLVATMDGNWSSAQYVGTLYYPDKTVTSEINSNLYDIDEGFKAVLDSKTQYRIENIDTPADAEKCIVTQIDSNSNSSVYYTVEDGEIIKHVDTHVVFLSEATTVIYTKVELGTASTLMGDVNGDGDVNVTDVALLVGHILGNENSNFIIENADVNGDGDITVTDVTKLVGIILEGDTPQAYLTCPDENHPHIIDLGLPSGTKWACCNVGAAKPEEYGGYYAWGETVEKTMYNRVTYLFCTGEDIDGNGMYDGGEYWDDLGANIAGTQYDVAHVQWGGGWQMPTKYQQIELLKNCTLKRVILPQNKGYASILTGPNGKNIYFPSPGVMSFDQLEGWGSLGRYWSSNEYLTDGIEGILMAHVMDFLQGWPYYLEDCPDEDSFLAWHREVGCSVRPVWVP